MSRSRDGGRCFMPHEYRNRRPAENLTRLGQENGKSSQLPDPGMVTWGPGRDPAKPAAPCPDRRNERLEGPDASVCHGLKSLRGARQVSLAFGGGASGCFGT